MDFTVTIVTVCFNAEDTIGRAINSVARQTYEEIEHIIVDGKSSDRTVDVIKSLPRRPGVCLVEKDNGIYDALNKGIAMASGDIVGILHADDQFTNDRVIQNVVSRFTKGVIGVYGDLAYVDSTGNTKREWISGVYSRGKMKNGWMPPHPTFFCRSELYESFKFDQRYSISADFDFLTVVFLEYGESIEYLPEKLVEMQVGGTSNKSLRNILVKMTQDFSISSKYHSMPLRTLAFKSIRKIPQLFRGKI